MKKILYAFSLSCFLWSCKTANLTATKEKEQIKVNINLNEIENDKVLVTIFPPKSSKNEISFHFPKTVPGTYSEDNYGKYIENLKAVDNKGKALLVTKTDDNSWTIANAKTLDKITYLVNDTFDTETGKGFGSGDIFSPAGSNIEAGKNIMMNTHCFVGYFADFLSIPYQLTVSHPATLWGATSMTDLDLTDTNDVFSSSRYAELVENPIMYAKPDHTSFTIDGMEIQIAVYSPKGIITAKSITPAMEKMMTAQKRFLGPVNATKKYTVLLYLSSMQNDATGFGALEHPTATTVVFPEIIPQEQLGTMMKDVVSHEFFHIVTPLTIHSQEIQNFDYNSPKMSEHLWMYEGVTEYFANLFQINQGLIDETEFYNRMAEKIEHAKALDDTMPFTTMSANVLTNPYKDQYLNVYEKGALIGMCIDIIIREKSNGERGILDLMQKLSKEYGVSKAFNDNELFAEITKLTYPEVGEFLKIHVAGPTPIPYELYLAKMGVKKSIQQKPAEIFIKGEVPYINISQETKEIRVTENIELNVFFNTIGLVGGDTLLSFNDQAYNLDTIFNLLEESKKWKENDPISVKIKRDGKEQTLNGVVKLPYEDKESIEVFDTSKSKLKEAWLKGK